MKTLLVLITFARVADAQASANWNTYGSDPQRSGWERTDPAISKDTVKDLQLLWKMKLEAQPKGLQPVLPPLIMGRLISYRGFKELAFVGTNSDIVYAIDADLGKMFWQKHLEYAALDPPVATSTPSCPGGLTAMPTMPPPAGRGGGRGAPPAAPTGGSGFLGAGPASVYAISSDGRLHRLNSSTGDDMVPPVSVLPANARAYSLNMNDNVIYTITGQACNGAADALWAIDLAGDALKVFSLAVNGGAGPAIGTDGTLYVQTSSALLALTPRDLQLKQSSALAGGTASPVVFAYKNRDVIVTAGKDGRLYLFDSASFGTALDRSAPLAAVEGLSTWEDNGTRWVLAAVSGASSGSIAAFKVEEQGGKNGAHACVDFARYEFSAAAGDCQRRGIRAVSGRIHWRGPPTKERHSSNALCTGRYYRQGALLQPQFGERSGITRGADGRQRTRVLRHVGQHVLRVRNVHGALARDFLPTPTHCGLENGIGHIVGGHTIAEGRMGAFSFAERLQKIGELMNERVLVADLQSGHPPVLHIRMIAIG